MSTPVLAISYEFELPWVATAREDKTFQKWLKRNLLLLLALVIIISWLPIPVLEKEKPVKIETSKVRLILEKKPEKKPLPPPPKPDPVKQDSAPPKIADKPKKAHAAPKKAAPKAVNSGVAAFSKQLSSLRSSLDVAKLRARNTNVKTGAAAFTQRSVLGSKSATATSGGISSDAVSRNGNSTQLAGHQSTSVSSPLGGGGDGSGSGAGGADSGGGRHGSSVQGGRDMESIRRTFEQHKGAIYALYNRILRVDPVVEGKFVFHIVIEPDGSISTIKLVSSELGNNGLEQKLLTRIRSISFGPEDVIATPVTYKFDFLPS